jgi:hypothetical protein
VNETTAQDASGSTITRWDDLRVAVFLAARAIARASEAVDAAGPVDAQNAPTGPWKTADGFPQASTAGIVSVIGKKESDGRDRPATINRVPLRSPAGLSLLTFRRQK